MAARGGRKKKTTKKQKQQQGIVTNEIILLVILGISILLLLSNFGFGGWAGRQVSSMLFGIFGKIAYIVPFVLFIGTAFAISNKGNTVAKIKVIAGLVFTLMLCAFLLMISVTFDNNAGMMSIYKLSSEQKIGGGIAGGAITKLLCPLVGTAGTYVIIFIMIIICFVLITEKSFFAGVKKGSSKVYESAKKENEKRRERAAVKREQRVDRKATGVSMDTALPKKAKTKAKAEIHEIYPEELLTPPDLASQTDPEPLVSAVPEAKPESLKIRRSIPEADPEEVPVSVPEEPKKQRRSKQTQAAAEQEQKEVAAEIKDHQVPEVEYIFPPLSLLKKGRNKAMGATDQQLRATALKLETTLSNFGVRVTVTDVSCGPSVTRYELQPEQGVKVSRIVNLADDIKLNLAAADIRIEAPIPGKAAVGIEVPNVENSTVMLRDLLESTEFQNHSSNIAFAAGRDIGGKIVVADIMKMPHLLIAGATGSGKSVCINTLIMSILYKASPEDVKLIMIDPKVVELSVYNGIPHLFIPVVTDPKKAAGALNWAVTEMNERYKKFADHNVRNLEEYNKKINSIAHIEEENKPEKLPQIVIIVDELADLMMVAPGEAEDAICRLAQLARAAGIHLILATQRPSVNVITGLIKANMPSRIAFSVSSGVDSRTIIDMNGAEKLLGKGDMLFYPAGYQKPIRVQGAFVSDKEVASVVDFLLQKHGSAVYDEQIEIEVAKAQTGSGSSGNSSENERDIHFEEAGRFIIEKDKASIGMLQRMYKIGFNRAARLMDQLADAGVVGPEEGTKPRKVLMSPEEFEQYIEEYL